MNCQYKNSRLSRRQKTKLQIDGFSFASERQLFKVLEAISFTQLLIDYNLPLNLIESEVDFIFGICCVSRPEVVDLIWLWNNEPGRTIDDLWQMISRQ